MALAELHIEGLLDHCIQGNRLAQMEVYHRYSKAMYNTALRIVNDASEAEDVMQEAFLTAFTRLYMLQNKADFGGWLKRIVINESINAHRKKIHHLNVDEQHITEEEYSSEEEEVENIADINQLKAQEIIAAIGQLKDNYRKILTLHYMEGYDHEEIAEIMELSYANSRTMLSRAKNNLKQLLLKK